MTKTWNELEKKNCKLVKKNLFSKFPLRKIHYFIWLKLDKISQRVPEMSPVAHHN